MSFLGLHFMHMIHRVIISIFLFIFKLNKYLARRNLEKQHF